MSEQFTVGEIAIHRPDADSPPIFMRLNGEDVEIIGPLMVRILIDRPYFCYDVRHGSGLEFYAAPHELRRRKPPAADSNERTHMQQWRDMASKALQHAGVPT